MASVGAAFIEAIGLASLIGCAIALAGSLFILRFMPSRHLPQDQEAAIPVQ